MKAGSVAQSVSYSSHKSPVRAGFAARPRWLHILAACAALVAPNLAPAADSDSPRSRISIDDHWRFIRGDSTGDVSSLNYFNGNQPGPGQPWVLPTGDAFLKDQSKSFKRPAGNLGDSIPYLAPAFDDSSWQQVTLPHDYAIEGPFITTGGGGMGRLPTSGVAWYRKNLSIPAADAGKSLFIDIDGAMSYSEVWLNGQFVGGWPYGYQSFRLNITPYAKPGQANTLAVRLDNPPNSSRWYTGAGIYRNVWLLATDPIHVGQSGTYLTTPDASPTSATIDLKTTVENDSKTDADVSISTQIFALDENDQKTGEAVAEISSQTLHLPAGANGASDAKTTLANPKLWNVGTDGGKTPSRYLALTTVQQDGKTLDTYQTPFGIRTLKYDPNNGFFLNGQHVKLNGVCDHHDLGALGSAVNVRALQRQLELLQEMGCNAIRTSHNPPAPELLDLCDKMGFLVMDESFDCWERQKTPNDYHLLFDTWYEQDLRAQLHRDRNHPSVILWSIGNEVAEQGGDPGPAIAKALTDICHEEDPTRQTVSAMNSARAGTPFPAAIDSVGLNYQGAGLNGRNPQYPVYHQDYPGKLIMGSETVDAFSSRGVYTFPIIGPNGTAASRTAGEDTAMRQISSYDLYHASWSYVPDYEFAAQDHFPFVAGEFVWTGFDYLGEPTPFDQSRSSYCGMLDLAGFKKDRFYFYQAHWRPDFPIAHILPDWTWPDRAADPAATPPRDAQVTPVMVYTSGDEAELFLNGKSQGRKKKAPDEYRLRWDDVAYQPGELHVVAYKDGKQWAQDTVKTAGTATRLLLAPDRAAIAADGKDLSFVTLTIADAAGQAVPRTDNAIHFDITGPGEIVATDNGDSADMTPFPFHDRKAFSAMALAIIRAKPNQPGVITLTATSPNLRPATTTITTK